MKLFITTKKIDEYEIDEQELRDLAIEIANFHADEDMLNWAKTASADEIAKNIPLGDYNYNYLLQSANNVETVSLEREIFDEFKDAFTYCEEGLISPIKFIEQKEGKVVKNGSHLYDN